MAPNRLITTALIIAWCAVFSMICCLLCYFAPRRRPGRLLLSLPILPALALGPLALWAGFMFFQTNLIFPIYLFSSWQQIVLYTIVPSVILAVGSGLLTQTALLVAHETAYWRAKPCHLVTIAYGKSVKRSFFKIVAIKALTTAWQRSLPWLLGELILLEIIFNIPGLGFESWRYAKSRDLAMLGLNLGIMIVIYMGCSFILLKINRWIGKRLATYG